MYLGLIGVILCFNIGRGYMDKEIEDRLDLLEQRYMITRERLSKLERVQYQIRDQIGFIQYLSKDPSSQKPIETRLTEIYQAIGQLMDQMDEVDAQQYKQPVTTQPVPSALRHIPQAIPQQPQGPSASTAIPPAPAIPAAPAIQHPAIEHKPSPSQPIFIKR
jgi:hypothetical protein